MVATTTRFEDAPLGLDFRESMTPRWTPLRIVPEIEGPLRDSLLMCGTRGAIRFLINTAGRRSGKTEMAKREGVMFAMRPGRDDAMVVFAAPTADQTKRIYWNDLKKMVPEWALRASPRYSIFESYPQRIELRSGATIMLIGMDKAQRLEGDPVDWICLDEYADMKGPVFAETVRPLVSTKGRPGYVRFIGKPRGRNHYWKLVRRVNMGLANPLYWSAYQWSSRAVLSDVEIAEMASDMDDRTFRQEVDAEFVDFAGRAYYAFEEPMHVIPELLCTYNPGHDLIFAFDFNVKPGVAAVIQERRPSPMVKAHLMSKGVKIKPRVAHVIDEVFVEEGSNTERVTKILLDRYKAHQGDIFLYGDSTGGAKKSSSLAGSDWEIVEGILTRHYGPDRIRKRVPNNPEERVRVNSMNRLLRTYDNQVGMVISEKCQNVAMDFSGVQINDKTQQLDKDDDPSLTHISDAIGYYADARWPASSDETITI